MVAGTTASLCVNGADQPCLIVNDLKLGDTHGQVTLWTGSNTEGYFSNLMVRQRRTGISSRGSIWKFQRGRGVLQKSCGGMQPSDRDVCQRQMGF